MIGVAGKAEPNGKLHGLGLKYLAATRGATKLAETLAIFGRANPWVFAICEHLRWPTDQGTGMCPWMFVGLFSQAFGAGLGPG
jgi:hypothetical protein